MIQYAKHQRAYIASIKTQNYIQSMPHVQLIFDQNQDRKEEYLNERITFQNHVWPESR